MENRQVHIYRLIDPRNLEVRYVGLTVQTLQARLWSHCSKRRKGHCSAWTSSLKALGLRPLIEEIETVDSSEADTKEKEWIAYYHDLGCKLTNHEEGGRRNHKIVSEETKAKISASLKGRTSPLKGKKVSDERRIALIALSTGHLVSPETKSKMSQAQQGKKHTAEARHKMSEMKKGKTPINKGVSSTPEFRAKVAASVPRGKQHYRHTHPFSEETRRRISEAKKAQWAKKKAEKENSQEN